MSGESDLPSEMEVVEALKSGNRDAFEDAEEVRRPDRYTIQYIHSCEEGELGLKYHYSGAFQDRGHALGPREATVLVPDYDDNGRI